MVSKRSESTSRSPTHPNPDRPRPPTIAFQDVQAVPPAGNKHHHLSHPSDPSTPTSSNSPCLSSPSSQPVTLPSSSDYDDEDDDEEEEEESDDDRPSQPGTPRFGEKGFVSGLLARRRSSLNRQQAVRLKRKGSRREKVRMVGHHLHQAFRSWFKETESDGSPILPSPLSKKYAVLPEVLGQGSFAVVKLVVEKSTGTKRALKIIAKKPLKDSNEKMLKEEIAILGAVEHPNIIKMWDMYETKEGVFIVTDLCGGGELFDRLVEKVHYNELDARHIMRQILLGVEYLHDHDIIHRDLKPENILLRDKTDASQVVISDFGLSRFIPEEGLLMTACGSPQYVSPEVLLGTGYGPAVDIWSSGVIAYSLLAGYTPFYGEDQPSLFQQIIQMKVEFEPEYWTGVSDVAKDFICRCLCPADRRMTAKQALAHPWLSDLPPIHDENDRGCCLKDGALRNMTAMRKLRKAVTAVEAVNHLTRLHALRQQHGEAHPEKQNSLLKIMAALRTHRRGESLIASPVVSNDDCDETHPKLATITNTDSCDTILADPDSERRQQREASRQKGGDRRGDSGMALDLVVMSMFLPENWGAGFGKSSGGNTSSSNSKPSTPKRSGGGTAAVARAAEATAHGQDLEEAEGERSGRDGQEELAPPEPDSPSASSTGQSDATVKPTRRSSSGREQSTKRKPSASSSALNTLLDQYKSAEVPSSAKFDPNVKVREPAKMTMANAWKYVPLLVGQGITIGSAVASHAFYGPPKKSWGIEMSVFTRIMRDVAQYSEFASISGLQQFFDLSSFLPTPKDGLITPVTFRVKRRNLRGFLAEADAQEDGKREISGEWVVGKQTWRRLQSEWRNGKQKGKERVILYIHGGAYFVMSAATHRPLTISLSKYTECRVFGINYRLAPDTRFPGALHDCVASWFRLTDDLGIPPSNIVLGADSAGGGLALATMYYLRDNGYELPSGAMLFSPWVDLTMSCDSWETNSKFDYLPMPMSGDHMNPVSAYLGENVNKYITHPYVSPLFGDMHGLPPLLIQAGDAEVLRDEITLLAHKASLAGVAVRHELYEDCVHVFQAFLFLDASRKALQSARHFVRTALDKRSKGKTEVGKAATDQINEEMRKNMSNSKGERVEPRTGESRHARERSRVHQHTVHGPSGQHHAHARPQASGSKEDKRKGNPQESEESSEGEDFASRDDEETWELDRRASVEDDKAPAKEGIVENLPVDSLDDSAAPTKSALDSSQADAVEEQRQASQAQDVESHVDEDEAPTPLARRSPATSLASLPPQAGHSRSMSSSSITITLEEARKRAEAAFQQQQSAQAAPLSKFHAPEKPLTPRLRRSLSGKDLSSHGSSSNGGSLSMSPSSATPSMEKEIDGLLKSFKTDQALKTNVWTPDPR